MNAPFAEIRKEKRCRFKGRSFSSSIAFQVLRPSGKVAQMGGRHAAAVMMMCLLLSACANVQSPVAEFGQTLTATAAAEDALFDPVIQRTTDINDLCILSATAISIDARGQITPTDFTCQGTTSPTSLKAAIDVLLKPVQAYAQALQALASDTGGTTFSTNVDTLGKSVTALNTNALIPLGVKGGPTTAQVGALGAAVKDIGNALMSFAISKDVQTAARNVQAPLHAIATNVAAINGYWTGSAVAVDQSEQIAVWVKALWRTSTYSDKQRLETILSRDDTPVSADAVNKALASVAVANDQIALAGPGSAIAAIQTASQAASDALAAMHAIKTRK